MTGQSETEGTVVTEPSNDVVETTESTVTLESLAAEIAKVTGINKELIASRDAAKAKAREMEQQVLQATEKRQGVQGELDAMEQKFNDRMNGVLIDSALERELAVAGARNVDAAKKLLDRQNISVVDGKADKAAIIDAINSLKESEDYMFKDATELKTPKAAAVKVARAGEPDNGDVVVKELKAATSIADLKAIIDKHNLTT